MDKHATLIFYTGAFHLSKPICPARQPPSVVPLSWMPLLFLLCGRRRRIPPKIRASVCLRECEWCARYSALRYVHFILFRRLLLHFSTSCCMVRTSENKATLAQGIHKSYVVLYLHGALLCTFSPPSVLCIVQAGSMRHIEVYPERGLLHLRRSIHILPRDSRWPLVDLSEATICLFC